MKTFTRTVTKNTYHVMLWDSKSKQMEESERVDLEELKPEQFEKSIKNALKAAGDSRKVVDVELISTESNLLEWDLSEILPLARPAKRAEYIMKKDNE